MDQDSLAILIFIVAVLFVGGTGIVILAATKMARERERYADQNQLKQRLSICGWVIVSLGEIGLLGVGVGVVSAIANNAGDPVGLVFTVIYGGSLSALFIVAGAMLIKLSHRLLPELRSEDEIALDRQISFTLFVGWAILIFPVGGILFPLVLPCVVLLALIGFVIGTKRRADQTTLLWLLAIAVEKNLPLPEEVDGYADTLSGRLRQKVRRLSDMLRTGVSLPEALSNIRGLVPRSAIVAIQLGEKSGQLSHVLRDIAMAHSKTTDENESDAFSFGSVFLYFGLVVLVGGGVVSFLMYFIIPKFKKIFSDFGTELPALTINLIEVSDSIVNYFYLFLPLLAVPVIAFFLAAAGFYKGWGEIELFWFGKWLKRLDTPGILRGLSLAVRSNLPVNTGLEVIAEHHRRSHIRETANRVVSFIQGGANIWDTLRAEKLLTQSESDVLSAAQRVGNLPWVLDELAETIERRRGFRWRALFEFLQPIFMILVGLCVMYICVALFMPLVKLLNDFS